MARFVGRRGGPWVWMLLGLLVLPPLAVFVPLAGAFALAAVAVAIGLILQRRAGTLAQRCDKLSGEIDVLSKRLLALEAGRTGDAAKAAEVARAETARARTGRAEGTADLSANVEEVTAEIGLLSGIVRELAAIVAAQDSDLAKLKAEPRPVPVPTAVTSARAQPAPAPSVSQEIVVPPRGPAAATAAPSRAPWAPRPLATVEARGGGEPADPPPPDRSGEQRQRETALIAAFEGDGLEVHLQPLVSLPQRKVVSYEAVARLRVSGEVLAPDLFLPVLERHGRTTDLDRRMIQKVATIGRHLGGRGSNAAVAYALSPFSLYEPGFLRSLTRLVSDGPSLAGRLVVSLPQESWRNLDAEQSAALLALRGQLGFTLDRPVDMRFDPLALADRGIGQIKIPAEMILRPGSRQAMPDIALEDLVTSLGRAGVRVVADGVEREADVPDLIDLGIPLAQGALFAPARAVRAEVLATAAAPQPPAPDGEPAPQRRPFRDFLRRAG
ncbi:EAL domain-containing protein [Methylobacterium sp. Leaf466]|uniref:EAL domain-containing protein n=1 Tax=Methylobacterium sp. Leaf466 TaxID=1736386 RepID=UPI0006F7A8A4|nr:EAL domain-containing protein [Methylobacterium sp. Leaf466]KQT87211.1 diguanylate phosphodiesterase [Methylobacterium sp. Leaf466]